MWIHPTQFAGEYFQVTFNAESMNCRKKSILQKREGHCDVNSSVLCTGHPQTGTTSTGLYVQFLGIISNVLKRSQTHKKNIWSFKEMYHWYGIWVNSSMINALSFNLCQIPSLKDNSFHVKEQQRFPSGLWQCYISIFRPCGPLEILSWEAFLHTKYPELWTIYWLEVWNAFSENNKWSVLFKVKHCSCFTEKKNITWKPVYGYIVISFSLLFHRYVFNAVKYLQSR